MTQAKQSITIRYHVGRDGILHLDVPVGMQEMDLEVTVTVQSVVAALVQNSLRALNCRFHQVEEIGIGDV